MIKVENFQIRSCQGKKELTVVGEFHDYNIEESKMAEKLLDQMDFNVLFSENPKLDRFTKFLYRKITRLIAIINFNNEKTLIEMCKEKHIPEYDLEKGSKIPIINTIGLYRPFIVLALLAFFSYYFKFLLTVLMMVIIIYLVNMMPTANNSRKKEDYKQSKSVEWASYKKNVTES